MKESNKYTHLIERVPGLVKEMATRNLRELTNMSIAENYWRLRGGKGLLSLYDQESLAIWSKLMSDIRRLTGTPVPIWNAYITQLRRHKIEILQQMEQYKNWLECGVVPIFYYDECQSEYGWQYTALNRALAEHIAHTVYDFRTVRSETNEEMSFWAMSADERKKIRMEHRNMVSRILDEGMIDWKQVYPLANEICKELDSLEDHAKKKAASIRKDIDSSYLNLEAKKDLYEELKEIQKVKRKMQIKYLLEYPYFINDEIWQIRTNFDNRSSQNADITERLAYIYDVPEQTSGHREIYAQNRAVLDEFIDWKNDIKKLSKEKKKLIKSEDIFDTMIGFFDRFSIPNFPTR